MDKLNKTQRKNLNRLKRNANESFNAGEFPDAIRIYTHAMNLYGTSGLLLAKRGECNMLLKDFLACVKDCTSALNINSDLATAYKYRGRAEWLLGNRENAVKDLRMACKLDYDEIADGWLKVAAGKCTDEVKGESAKQNVKANPLNSSDTANSNCEADTSNCFINRQIIFALEDPVVIAAFKAILLNGSALVKFLQEPKIWLLILNIVKEAAKWFKTIWFAMDCMPVILGISKSIHNDATVQENWINLQRANVFYDILKGPYYFKKHIKNRKTISDMNKLAKQSIHIATKEITKLLFSAGVVPPQNGGIDLLPQLIGAAMLTFSDSEVFNAFHEMYTNPNILNILKHLNNPKVWSVCKSNTKIITNIISVSVLPMLINSTVLTSIGLPQTGSDLTDLFRDPEFVDLLQNATTQDHVSEASNLLKKSNTLLLKVIEQLIRMFVDEMASSFTDADVGAVGGHSSLNNLCSNIW